MSIGKLDQRVSFYRNNETSDGMGGASNAEELYATLWANVKEIKINRFFEPNSVAYSKKIDITIRLNASILDTMIIEYDGNRYSIENKTNDEKYTYIQCQLK